jgi:post-segregation antitoxin (ccd killing protein)
MQNEIQKKWFCRNYFAGMPVCRFGVKGGGGANRPRARGVPFIQQCPQRGITVQKYTYHMIFTNSMQPKKQVHLIIPAALHNRARELGINLSIICRKCIAHRVKMIEEGLERDRNIERIT